MRSWLPIFSLTLLSFGASGLRAGDIINSNLPTGTTIVNISGTADGAAGNDPGGGRFSQPFTADVSLSVSPGTYSFSIVDPADAAQEFPALTAAQLGSIQTAWTFNSPWTTDYVVFDSSALSDSNEIQLFDGASNTANAANTYGSAQAAYDAAVAGGYTNFIRTGPRTGTTYETSYTFTSAATLLFAVPDYDLGDNAGGVSVIVHGVPEPRTTLPILAGAVLGAAGVTWRREMWRTRA